MKPEVFCAHTKTVDIDLVEKPEPAPGRTDRVTGENYQASGLACADHGVEPVRVYRAWAWAADGCKKAGSDRSFC